MKIFLYAKSSDGVNYYKVAFTNHQGIISIKCDCHAGQLTKLCRHKLALIRGEEAILYDNSQGSELMIIKEWIKTSPLAQLLVDHDSLEKQIKEKQRELKIIKEVIEIAMRRGA